MPERVEITGPSRGTVRRDPVPQGTGAAGHAARRARRPAGRGAGGPAAPAGRAVAAGRCSTSSRRPRTSARTPSWRVAPPAPGLVDRRVEITGPTDRKMTINALNSGANVWLADFEDANTPLWSNMIEGQLNLKDALDRTIDFTSRGGQVLRAQPRRHPGHHRGPAARLAPGREAHPDRRAAGVRQPHRLRALHGRVRAAPARQGQGARTSTWPKMESHLEARLWNDAFNIAQDYLAHPARHDQGHGADRDDPGRVRDGRDPLRAARALRGPERGTLGLPVLRDQEVPHPGPRLRAARAERGDDDRPVHARLHRAARADLPQARRVRDGRHGGVHPVPARRRRSTRSRSPRSARTRPARPATGSTAPGSRTPTWCRCAGRCSTGCSAPGPTSSTGSAPRSRCTAADLLAVAKTPGGVTEAGLRNNISVALQYLAAWLGGTGAVAIFNLMEDAATAEISRSQIWQWIHNDVILDDGPLVTKDVVERMIDEELVKIRELAGRRLRRGQVRSGGRAVHRGGARGLLRGVPDAARVRTHAVGRGTADGPDGDHDRVTASVASSRAADAGAPRRRSPRRCATICGAADVLTDPLELRTYECDGLTSHRTVPALVVLPESAAEVAAVVRVCARAGVPFVARGSGTGLSGGAVPHAEGVLIVMSRMRRVLEVDPVVAARGGGAWRDQPVGDAGRARRTACSTRPTRPRRWSARWAGTSRRTPAARTASSTGSPSTTCSAWRSSPRPAS